MVDMFRALSERNQALVQVWAQRARAEGAAGETLLKCGRKLLEVTEAAEAEHQARMLATMEKFQYPDEDADAPLKHLHEILGVYLSEGTASSLREDAAAAIREVLPLAEALMATSSGTESAPSPRE